MLKRLQISDFRSVNIDIRPSPTLNYIVGGNGSGKSSILEALHYLSFARSFRASSADKMIKKGASGFIIRAEIEKDGMLHQIAIQRKKSITQVLHQGNKSSFSKIAAIFPSLFVDSHSYRCYFSQPQFRRRLLDWLVFHVKPCYMASVRRYMGALRHRNAGLKVDGGLAPWERLMASEASEILMCRKAVYSQMDSLGIVAQFPFMANVGLQYTEGFSSSIGFMAALDAVRYKDKALGRTTIGPHVADWVLKSEGEHLPDILSQGQLKSAYLSLIILHQMRMLKSGIQPCVLIDDLLAELDNTNSREILNQLLLSDGQYFVSSISMPDFAVLPRGEVFHVDRIIL
ncbi:DNA replication/repair protein RecF [Candidatus Synchoanobacter obligatus]|uniref:DNA replication and repair protein RecF n=1 Tax=Candidatus Synchoanobacter obligatus TaxID=2919597 RepID=A0ABT1L4Y7_9GAMM|nr:DNA replication and repair protein RecF [Candidatus Synchoanobacter obligatus]MCP8352242.1 DNA replication and repair protein RecF [Candidatus Synchoanobacter obligatus]